MRIRIFKGYVFVRWLRRFLGQLFLGTTRSFDSSRNRFSEKNLQQQKGEH
jgi:hypothetical protein